MGRAPISKPSYFSLQIIELARREVIKNGGDLSGRWLAKETGLSATYLRERLIGQRPFNTNDVFVISELFGYSPKKFVETAMLITELSEELNEKES